jgi:SOS-response transcriptional repressor LexA
VTGGGRVTHATPMTRIQRHTLEFIAEHIAEKGYPPSVRDIQLAFSIGSTNAVHDRIVALEKRGLVQRRPMISRGLILTERGKALMGARAARLSRTEPSRPEPTIVRTSPVETGQCPGGAVTPSEGENES